MKVKKKYIRTTRFTEGNKGPKEGVKRCHPVCYERL